ncbi:MAG: threonine ammonia-lyase [Hyphomicrobiaceae bacterium]
MSKHGTPRDVALPVTLADVQRAAGVLKGAIIETDFDNSRTLSAIFGADVWLKFENLQFTASYKERGALNKLMSLTPEERACGVIAMSAGNHAQGVAYHAELLGIPATIVMPATTPTVKVENTKALGASVILHGDDFEEAARFARAHGASHSMTFIHPFDDPVVIAGQGTIALEMLANVPDLDTLIVPIGGGGLISGMAVAAKGLKPDIRVIGVEAKLYPSMYNVMRHASLPIGGETLAEGIAVREPGYVTREIVSALVDDILLVSEAELERALTLLITVEKTVVEGAGAAGLAALLADRARFQGHKVGIVLCGGNIDTGLLASVLTRELARDGRLSRIALDLPDRPGQLAKVSAIIGEQAANVVEVYHQRVFTDLPAKGTELHLVIETRDAAHLQTVLAVLRSAGYAVLAKSGGGLR